MATKPRPFVVEFRITDPRRIQSPVRIGTPITQDNGKLRFSAVETVLIGIWDTGAPYTLVVPSVVQTASLIQRGFKPVGGLGTEPKDRPAYPASIVFGTSDGVHFQFVDVTMLEDDEQLGGAHVLIGMDIIGRGETRIWRKRDGLWFSFTPEQNHE